MFSFSIRAPYISTKSFYAQEVYLRGRSLFDGIVGVWRTTDASDAEGKGQGGFVLRSDGSGEIISASFRVSGLEDLRVIAGIPDSGFVDMEFKYTMDANNLVMKITRFHGVKVNSKPTAWTVVVSEHRLELTSALDRNKWIISERV
jgi:hypothetical protein